MDAGLVSERDRRPTIGERVPGWLVWLVITLAMVLGFFYAPPEATMGDVQRIMYFHVASAWNAFLAFFVVAWASISTLRTGSRGSARLAWASAEVGVFFTSLCILSGSVWAKAVWHVWWTWEPRLTTTLVLWFIYIGYLVMRGASEDEPSGERMAAVLGVIGAMVVPLVYFSALWWQGLHPIVISLSGFGMPSKMVEALFFAFFAFTVLYLWLLGQRIRLLALSDELAQLRQRFRGA